MSKKNPFTIRTKNWGLGKRVLFRSGLIAGGITAGTGLGILSGNPTGMMTLAGTTIGLIGAQHIASKYMQYPKKRKKKK